MYRTLLICAVVSASTLGCSITQPRPDAQQTASAATRQPCALETGSRIAPNPGECSMAPGRSYSQTDIQRTGEVDVAEALHLLDPSITVHH
jgi:hypothetical protein